MKPRKITCLAQLQEVCLPGAEVFIALRPGLISRKWIRWDPVDEVFVVYNYIDDSEQVLSARQILDCDFSNVGYAMRRGALYLEGVGP